MGDLTDEYVAGFFDGEGSVTIAKIDHNRHKKWQYPSYFLVVCITQTEIQILEDIESKYGGSICRTHTKGEIRGGRVHKRNSYQWRVGSTKSEFFLRSVLPYVRMKKPQVELALRFVEHIKAHPRTEKGRCNKARTQEAKDLRTLIATERQAMRDELKGLRHGNPWRHDRLAS